MAIEDLRRAIYGQDFVEVSTWLPRRFCSIGFYPYTEEMTESPRMILAHTEITFKPGVILMDNEKARAIWIPQPVSSRAGAIPLVKGPVETPLEAKERALAECQAWLGEGDSVKNYPGFVVKHEDEEAMEGVGRIAADFFGDRLSRVIAFIDSTGKKVGTHVALQEKTGF